MDAKEKYSKLLDYCHGRSCIGCPMNIDKYCRIAGDPPSETIDRLYGLVFNAPAEAPAEEAPTAPTILDSGHRREFSTGSVRDMAEGKGRMDLLPWAAIMEVSKHCENGCKKYGEHNIDLGQNTSVLGDSAARHLAKWMEGWTDEPHLLAAAWNLLWAIQMELTRPDLCNVPWRPEK